MRVTAYLSCLLLGVVGPAADASLPVVDEPLGARYSLGMTLWHMGHSAEMTGRFHEYLLQQQLTPDRLLPAARLKAPASVTALLLEPELATPEQLAGWTAEGECAVSGAGDAGPTMSLPLRVPKAGTYRLWVRFIGNAGGRGVTFLKIYRAGQEHLGPLDQADEVYAEPPAQAGPLWHDLIVDLPAGDLVVKMGHVTRWWHGPGNYDLRRIDCLYLTEALWAAPPTGDQLQAVRKASGPRGLQWTAALPLPAADKSRWKWWQVRPLSWEQAATNPKLFALSRSFWQQTIAELAQQEYPEERDKLPDYRAPERQVVFNETWNLVANPVRARRQIEVLQGDVCRQPLPYHYVWHDIAGNIPDLTSPARPKSHGDWSYAQNCLFASYGNPTGTVATEVPVRYPGKYAMWVLSEATNLSYTAPWFGTVSVAGQQQFRYHHEGQIPSLWMKMGEVTVPQPGPVKVEFTLDGAGAGGTYRRVYTLFLVDDLGLVPKGTVRPPWTLDMYRERAQPAGARPGDKLLVWTTDSAYTPLTQEVWADRTTGGRSWPDQPVKSDAAPRRLVMARDTVRAVQVCLRNLTDQPLTLSVQPGPLRQGKRALGNALNWRVVAFAPSGPGRQDWVPFFLLRRPNITVPPLNVAGVWLTVDARGVPPGDYTAAVRLTGRGTPLRSVALKVHISPVAAKPRQPVLVDGYTQPHEGEAYLRDHVAHGLKVWRGEMTRADMRKWGLRLQAINCTTAEAVARLKTLGLDYDDWFAVIMDEPGGKTEEELKPFIDIARALRAADPKVRISFNPGEAATLPTFLVLAPYCDFWLPYSLHLSQYWGGPEKWAIYKAKPWMWYTTPCLWDKSPGLPEGIYAQIRQVPGQTGQCVGTAFFALNYPWRDQWDTAYEHIPDASTMGAVMSRHGPVATRTWEAIREAIQHADLAMLARERSGAKTFDEVKDPALPKLIADGSVEELLAWLEKHPQTPPPKTGVSP